MRSVLEFAGKAMVVLFCTIVFIAVVYVGTVALFLGTVSEILGM